MKQYLDLMRDVLGNGVDRDDRTGTGTRSVFGRQMRFDLSKGFPLLTTKRVYWKGVVYELLWFIAGRTDNGYLTDHNVHIWDEWADKDDELPYVYGKQYRNFGADWVKGTFLYRDKDGGETLLEGEMVNTKGVDQLKNLIDQIRTNPNSRRLIVSAWNPIELPLMALPPCHMTYQMYVANGKLSCQLYQRSCDVFLGLPFNIASYSLLTHMIAKSCDLEVGEFVWTGGDIHIYHNHFDQAKEQLSRVPGELPNLLIKEKKEIFDYDYDDFELVGYNPQSKISAPIAV